MEIEVIRQRAEFLALEMLVTGIAKSLQRYSPAFATSLRAAADQKTEELRLVRFQDTPPEWADTLSAELQEAFERLMQRVLLKPGE